MVKLGEYKKHVVGNEFENVYFFFLINFSKLLFCVFNPLTPII